MTNETRVLISPSDIEGIEFKCRQCGVRVMYPLESSESAPANGCPNCKTQWLNFRANEDDDLMVVKKFIQFLKAVSSRKTIGSHLRLQITPSTSHTTEPESR